MTSSCYKIIKYTSKLYEKMIHFYEALEPF